MENQFMSLLKTSSSIAKQYGMIDEHKNLSKILDHCYDNSLNLLICGEFKRGKSSLINALLNDNICAVADGIATSAVSVIRYGEKESATRYYSTYEEDLEKGQKLVVNSESIDFASISNYAVGTSFDIDNTLYIDIEIPNHFLKEKGFTRIDTPGIGSLDPRHLFLTLQILPQADAILFVTDSSEPMMKPELDFVKDRILPLNKPFDVVLNKSDLVSRNELSNFKEDIQSKILDYCGTAINCIPISSSEWMEYNYADRESVRERRRKNSNCDELLTVINGFFKRKIESIEAIFKLQYEEFLNSMKSIVGDTILELSNTSSNDSVINYRQQLAEIKNLRDQVLNEESELRTKINSIIESSQDCVLGEFSKDSVLLSTEWLEEVLNNPKSSEEDGADYVISQMNQAIKTIGSSIDKKIDSAIVEVVNELKSLIENASLTTNTNQTQINGDITPVTHSFSESFVNLTRQALPFVGVTSISGGIASVGLGFGAGLLGITSVAVPIIGGCIGVAAGIYYVVQSIKGTKRQEALNNIRKQISPRISIAVNELRNYIHKRYTMFSVEVVKILKNIAKSMAEQMQEKLKLIQECEKDSQKKAAKIKELQNHITMIDNLITQTKVLNTNPFAN